MSTHIRVGDVEATRSTTFLLVKVVPTNGLPLVFTMRDLGLAIEVVAHFRLHAKYVTLMQRGIDGPTNVG